MLAILWLGQGIVTVVGRGSILSFLNSQHQLEINTITTIITVLMVVLLQIVRPKTIKPPNTSSTPS